MLLVLLFLILDGFGTKHANGFYIPFHYIHTVGPILPMSLPITSLSMRYFNVNLHSGVG